MLVIILISGVTKYFDMGVGYIGVGIYKNLLSCLAKIYIVYYLRYMSIIKETY